MSINPYFHDTSNIPLRPPVVHCQVPHRCPICEGEATITTRLGSVEQCPKCKGERVLWSNGWIG